MQWRIELLGRLRLTQGERVVTPFLTQKVGALLACLAYYRHQSHPREMLIELLWPEIDPEVGRHNLRSLLHLLRRQVEAAGSDAGSLVTVGRSAVQLDPAVATDVAEFVGAIEAAASAGQPQERAQQLTAAQSLYQGELLPGAYEPWVLTERQWLAELHLEALHRLAAALEQCGDLERAVEAAQRAVTADPLREESHHELMRLYAAAGRPSATVKQYQELERILQQELGETPSAATQALVAELRETARDAMLSRSPTVRTHRSAPEAEDLDRQYERPEPDRSLPGAPPGAPAPARLPVQFTSFFGREEAAARRAWPSPQPGGCRRNMAERSGSCLWPRSRRHGGSEMPSGTRCNCRLRPAESRWSRWWPPFLRSRPSCCWTISSNWSKRAR
jgi:DNA-binding SARP family transcriptional activator